MKSSLSNKISLPFPIKGRQKFLADRIVQLYGGDEGNYLDKSKASYKLEYGNVTIKTPEGNKVMQHYTFAFEIIAIPYDLEMIRADKLGLTCEFIGLVNSSYSALGTRFEGHYKWNRKKNKKKNNNNNEPAYAYNIVEVLQEYGFPFSIWGRKKRDKVPCIIAGNLISDRIDYTEKSKARMDISPFANTIVRAVEKVSRGIKTFDYYGIDFESDRHSSSSYTYRSSARPRYATTYIKDVVKEMLLPRIQKVKAGEKITTEQTQDSLWYNALPLFVKHNVKYSNKSRPHFKICIRELCEEYDVAREEIGIIAAPWATMFFNGKWYDVSYETVKSLANNGTDIIFIEKRDIVQALSKYAQVLGVALVNTHGHLTDYVKDLAEFAQESGAHLGIMTDYDIPGIHIASKLKDVVWLGVDEDTLEQFGISHEDRTRVVPYNPQRRLLDETIEEILEDERFSNTDEEFLKHNKVEIDAVLSHVGAERLWQYLIERMKKAHPTRDYTRVIDIDANAPTYGTVENFIIPPIVERIKKYVSDRYESLTEESRQEYEEELEDYEGFTIVQDKESEIHDELYDIVDKDQQSKDITDVLQSAGKLVESTVKEAILSAIKKLDAEKGYGIMEAIGGDDDGGGGNEGGGPRIDT